MGSREGKAVRVESSGGSKVVLSEPIPEIRSLYNPLGRTILTLELIRQLVGAALRAALFNCDAYYFLLFHAGASEYLTDTAANAGKRANYSANVDTFHLKLSPLNEV